MQCCLCKPEFLLLSQFPNFFFGVSSANQTFPSLFFTRNMGKVIWPSPGTSACSYQTLEGDILAGRYHQKCPPLWQIEACSRYHMDLLKLKLGRVKMDFPESYFYCPQVTSVIQDHKNTSYILGLYKALSQSSHSLASNSTISSPFEDVAKGQGISQRACLRSLSR